MTEQGLTVKQKTVADMLEKNKGALASAYPYQIDADRLVRLGMAVIRKEPKLLNCTAASVISALMEAAALGLSFDPNMQQAYLIAYGKEAKMQLDYRGVIALAERSGKVEDVEAQVVKENDAFDYEDGTEHFIKHKKLLVGDRGKTYAGYCIVTYKTGYKKFHIMDLADLEKVRSMSKQPNSLGWKERTDEMYRKTVAINTLKWVDKTPEATLAIVHDQNLEFGDVDISAGEVIDMDPIEKPTAELKAKAKASKADEDPKPEAAEFKLTEPEGWVDEGDPNG